MKLLERIKNLFRPEGEITDGYHTFDELYEYRMAYNAALFNMLVWNGNQYDIHKSRYHYDGKLCFGGGWFIVMANLPSGQVSNHYPMKYWDMFQVPARACAKKWDGHTPIEALQRIEMFSICEAALTKDANDASK